MENTRKSKFYCGCIRLFGNKYLDWEFHFGHTYCSGLQNRILDISAGIYRRIDHTPICFILGIRKIFLVDLCFYDSRHWDYKTNTYKTYEI